MQSKYFGDGIFQTCMLTYFANVISMLLGSIVTSVIYARLSCSRELLFASFSPSWNALEKSMAMTQLGMHSSTVRMSFLVGENMFHIC